MNMSRPLVTGAGGFIGFNLALALSEQTDCEYVYVLDLPQQRRLEHFRKYKKFKVIEADLCMASSFDLLPMDVSHVFALAALNGTSRFYSNPYTVLMSSSLPTLAILNRYSKTTPITYTSSSEVYASTVDLFGWRVPTPEDIPVSISDVHNPRWSYAAAKLFGEVALTSAIKEHAGKGVIVRYHNVYGKNMGTDHFVPDFVNRVREGKKIVFGANQTRSFLHISDAIDGTIRAAQVASADVPIFHLGSNRELSILDAAKIILELMHEDSSDLVVRDAPEGSVSRRCPDTSLAKQVLNWEALKTFEEGISEYLS